MNERSVSARLDLGGVGILQDWLDGLAPVGRDLLAAVVSRAGARPDAVAMTPRGGIAS
jgi:hypothetical protein